MPVLIFGVLFSLIWSSAFIAGKISLEFMTPLGFLSFRFLSAGVLLLAVWLALQKRANLPTWHDKQLWQQGAILGVLNYVFYLGFSYTGLRTVSPELVILIVAATPFVVSILSFVVSRCVNYRQLAVIGLGFVGVYVALLPKLNNAAFGMGVLWVLAGVLAFAVGTLHYRHYAKSLHPLPLIGIQNLSGGVILLPWLDYNALHAAMQDYAFIGSWLYQVVMISIVSMAMWFALVRRIGADLAAVFHLLNPSLVSCCLRYFLAR